MKSVATQETTSISGSNITQFRKCPLCDGNDSTIEYKDKLPAETLNFAEIEKSWVTSFKYRTYFTYNRCCKCGMLYSPIYFNDSTLARLYKNMPENNQGIPSDSLIKTQECYFNFLEKKVSLTGNYLEIGPDVGHFTKICSQIGNFKNVWLYEPNVNTHDALKKSVKAETICISTNMSDFSQIPDQSLSLAIMIHVLDHVIEPTKTILEIHKKLRANGAVLIVTHDEKSLLTRVLGTKWPPFCLQHPHLFNTQTISKMLKVCGLENISTYKTPNYFPVTHLLRHFVNLIGISPDLIPKLSKPQIPLMLGNIATIGFKSCNELKAHL